MLWTLNLASLPALPPDCLVLASIKAAEGQAGLFSDGHAELKACLEEIKVLRSQSSELADAAKLDPVVVRRCTAFIPLYAFASNVDDSGTSMQDL